MKIHTPPKPLDIDQPSQLAVEIRRATSQDLDECYALERLVSESRPQAADEGFLLPGDSREDYDEFLSCGPFFVAASKGQVIGFIFGLNPASKRMANLRANKAKFQVSEPELFDDPQTGFMAKAAVLPEAMGHGVAPRLYREILATTPTVGYLATTVIQPIRNLRSEALQRKFGFKIIGEVSLGDRGSFKDVKCLVHYRPPTLPE